MSHKMKENHQAIRAHMQLQDGQYYLRLSNIETLARLTDDQVLAMAAAHLSKQSGFNVRGAAVAPGFHITAKDQRHFNFNFFNTDDSISNQELREKLKWKLDPHYAGHYPEIFRYGVGKLDFYFVVGEVNRASQVVLFTHIGHVDRPSTFFRRIRTSRAIDGAIGNPRQSTHYIEPEYTHQYISRLV